MCWQGAGSSDQGKGLVSSRHHVPDPHWHHRAELCPASWSPRGILESRIQVLLRLPEMMRWIRTPAGNRNRLLEGSWGGGQKYLLWKELIFRVPTSPKVVFGGDGSAALPAPGSIPKGRHRVAGVGQCMGKTMGKGRGERGGRALREEEQDMAGEGGRAKAVLWPLLAPRGCQSKNLWYLLHAQGISVYCQETSS